jgi:hypothetical protein
VCSSDLTVAATERLIRFHAPWALDLLSLYC